MLYHVVGISCGLTWLPPRVPARAAVVVTGEEVEVLVEVLVCSGVGPVAEQLHTGTLGNTLTGPPMGHFT